MEATVPQSIPHFSKRLRYCSRLSEGWCVAPDSMYDDMLYIPVMTTKKLDDENTSGYLKRWSTSTPLPDSTSVMRAFNHSICSDFMPSLACSRTDNFDGTKDSGRWSMDTSDFEDSNDLHLPRLSLESQFDQASHDSQDSAYESKCNSQDGDHSSLTVIPQNEIEALSINDLLKRFMPSVPDRLIGKCMGRDQVDMIGELYNRNMQTIIGTILSHVDSEDLCNISAVNSTWRKACYSDKAASEKLSDLRKQQLNLSSQKENITHRAKKTHSKRSFTQPDCVLGEVQTVQKEHVQSPIISTPTWQEAASRLLSDESLCKCPRCSSPSRVLPAQDRGQCSRCSHDFCTQCLLAYHGSSSCSITVRRKKTKTDRTVCAQKSKRNLRRL